MVTSSSKKSLQVWDLAITMPPPLYSLFCQEFTVHSLARLLQVKEPKVFAHGNMRDPDILSLNWPGCPWGQWDTQIPVAGGRTTNCQQWRCVHSVCVIRIWIYHISLGLSMKLPANLSSPRSQLRNHSFNKGLAFLGENLSNILEPKESTRFSSHEWGES